MKRMFQNYIVPQKFVKGCVDHVQGGEGVSKEICGTVRLLV